MSKKYLKKWGDRTMVTVEQGNRKKLEDLTGKSGPYIRKVLMGGCTSDEAFEIRRVAYETLNFGFITFE